MGERGRPGAARVDEVAALFAAVAGIGPFFAVATGPEPGGGHWVPVRALAGGPARPDPARPDALSDRIAAVRAALRTDDRVAASTAFQGLAAQLVAPLFAAVTVHGVLPAVVPDATWRPVVVPDGPGTAARDHEARRAPPGTATGDHEVDGLVGGVAAALHWQPAGPGPWLWWAGDGRVVPCADAAVLGRVLDGLLAPLVAAVRTRVSVSERVLWGDAASAVASARRLVCAVRPAASARSTDVARALLAAAPLAATAALRPPTPPDAHWTFRRRSCCLYHRAPGGGLCEDCVLQDRRPRSP